MINTSVFNIILRTIRNIVGGLFCFVGLCVAIAGSVVSGLFVILLGITLLPILYEKINFSKFKYASIILPVSCFVLFVIFMPKNNSEVTETNDVIETSTTVISQEDRKIEIESLSFEETEIELDIKETKNITLGILPEDADINDLEYCTTDSKIAVLERTDITSERNKITLQVKPYTEGTCEVFAKSSNGIISNKVNLKIVDNERIQAEEQTRKLAEQNAITQNINKTESDSNSGTKNVSNSTQTNSNVSTVVSTVNNSKTVYRTPKGKRYHYDSNCGGKNSYKTTLDLAKSAGLTPCKKCAA